MRTSVKRPDPGRWTCRTLAAGALLAAGLALAPVSASAQARAGLDPQTTNVPYLAWRGEQIRLAVCLGRDRSQELLARESGRDGFSFEDFLVEDWSGPDPDRAKPQVEQSTRRIDVDERGRVCFSADVVSQKAGIAPVKLVVSFDGTPVFKHQFLAVWMNTLTPRITEVAAADVGDPLGDGNFVAGGKSGRVRVDVTGNVPLLGNYAELGLGASLTLPTDYPRLAGALARSDNPGTDRNPLLWDVHDDQATTEGHPSGPCRVPGDAVTIDAGDNCTGGGETGPFSAWNAIERIAFLSNDRAIGPFDPVRAEETYLPDGKLDASDAPMPALRIDVAIAPNSGGATDISGIGTLEKVDKANVYSRNGAGNALAHNLYAPFYKTYLPATERPGMASGIDGPKSGGNFPGFLNGPGAYDFWSIARELRTAAGGSTRCLRRSDVRQPLRQRPAGAQNVVVYTDEHGEAQVAFRPGVDAYYDSLVTPDGNGACDLQGIAVLGTADIQATARYPYQPVTDPDKVSATLRKTVRSLFNKVLSYAPKGTTAATQNVRLVTAHAQDVDGSPFARETVCFSSDANGEAIISRDEGATVRDPFGGGRTCVRTDEDGNAVVELLNSNATVVDVIAHFTDERLFRNIKVDFGTAGSSGGTPPPVLPASAPGTLPGTNAGASTPSAGQIQAGGVPAGAVASVRRSASRRTTVRMAELVRSARGGAYVRMRVDSSRSKVRIAIRVLGRRGRSVGSMTRTVATNRRVKVQLSGAVAKRAKSVRVALR